MEDALLTIWMLVIVLGIPGLVWYFIIRKIVRGRRAARAVLTLAATLTEEQAEEFDRSLLPQARNIFEQLELMVEYVREINQVENKEASFQPTDDREDEELKHANERADESGSVANTVISPSNIETKDEDSVVQQLERLASLYQKNLLTETEYTGLKSQLIDIEG